MSDEGETVAELEAVDVLAGAPDAALRGLASLLTPFTAAPGTTLMREGEAAHHFILLTDGEARVVVGERDDNELAIVAEGSIVGEIALLRERPRASTVTALTPVRGLMGGRAAFTQLLAIEGVADKVVTRARRRLAAGLVPVPMTLDDGTALRLRPVLPADQWRLLEADALISAKTRYRRFFSVTGITPATARYLTEVDYIDHFVWVAIDDEQTGVGGASYIRSRSDPSVADISFSIMDELQGRGLGALLMGALAIAARRNGISRFAADVLSENAAMVAILNRAGMEWDMADRGIRHGTMAVPEPAPYGIAADTERSLGALVDEIGFRAWHSLGTTRGSMR
ncbi:GNAT family N-acetyltransferase [Acidimicrobiia bacterium EGI L10123]|uniref:GNAT family N-acetyltransferase n=1 Tax=Salinilacustrithrix flava TaxID=2957203 RepID=UPI003D7C3073|nr:GNAT family N-acetyltransferase [Acidimicrobiia bacterium EGI L10123]